MAERIIAALDAADGKSDGLVTFAPTDPANLHLILPSIASAEVQGGVIVLDGTRPEHVLGTASGSQGVNQTTTPRDGEDIASFIATAINTVMKTKFVGSQLRAAVLDGQTVAILDASGGVGHTVDVTAAPSLTLSGTPGVTAGNLAVPFFPTDTLQEIITGGPPVIVEQQPPLEARAPGVLQAINRKIQALPGDQYIEGQELSVYDAGRWVTLTFDNVRTPIVPGPNPILFDPGDPAAMPTQPFTTATEMAQRIYNAIDNATTSLSVTRGTGDTVVVGLGSGLNVVASQRAFPDVNIVALEGTAGKPATFAPGVSPFQPWDVIPVFVDDSQTANDVAERIALGIRRAVARGDLALIVAPHLNGDLGYENPSVPPGEVRTNLVNVSGAKEIQLSSGAASLIALRGVYGLNDPNVQDRALVTMDSDMDRVQVADRLDATLESWLHNPTIITEDGLTYHDEDSFVLDDGVNAAATYEFDTGYIVAVPIGGAVVVDGGIKDGVYFTLTDPSGTFSATFEFDTDNSLIHSPAEAVPIPMTDRDNALTVARSIVEAVQNHPLRSSLGMTPRLLTGNRVQIGGSRGSTLTISPGSTLTQLVRYVLEIPTSGGSAFRDAAAFSLTDGAATARFEFDKVFGLLPPSPNAVSWPVSISDSDDREAVMQAVIAAVESHPLGSQLGLSANRLSGGRVALYGKTGVTLSSPDYTFLIEPDGQPGVTPAVTLQLPETLAMQLPDPLMIHVPDGGIVDGETFVIGDGTLARTFEFEDIAFANGVGMDGAIGVPNVPNIAVGFQASDGSEGIGRAILQAIGQSSLFVSPTMLGGTGNIDLGGGANLTLTLSSPTTLFQTGRLSLQTPADDPLGTPNARTSGQKIGETNNELTTERFTISVPVDANTTNVFVFEFDSDGVVAPKVPPNPPVISIHFERTDNQDQLADRIVAAMKDIPGLDLNPVKSTGPVRVHLGAVAYDSNPATRVTLDTLRSHLSQTGQTDVLADGQQFFITNGWSSLRDPALPPLQLRVPAAGGSSGGVIDGEWFEIADHRGSYVTRYVFELDSDGVISTPPSANETEAIKPIGIPFLPTDSQDHIADRIRDTVDRAIAGMTPVNRFNGLVELAVDPGVDPAGFTLTFPTVVTFEFDLDGEVTPGAAAVDVFSGSTPQQIASEIVREINRTNLGLKSRYLGDGKIHLGGTPLHQLDAASAPD